jgi:hypothetical protein
VIVFILIQFLFALTGKAFRRPSDSPLYLRIFAHIGLYTTRKSVLRKEFSSVVVSRDGFFRRMRLFLRLAFVPSAYAQLVEGQAAQLAEQLINERDKQAKVDRLVAEQQRKKSTQRAR